ncbi:MAG: DUF1576 domain-containing protein [Tissierellia bacterium]|nr:DUF1576 domain-containing protein [Tissierellia bacterium]
MLSSSKREIYNIFWYKFFIIFGIFFLVASLVFNTPTQIFQGFLKILTSSGVLLTDYMEVGNIGATFFNVSLMIFLSVAILFFSKTEVSGVVIAAVVNVAGFAMMGKNPYNSLSPIIGVYLYSIFMEEDFFMYTPIALFATSVAPFVSYITFYSGFPLLEGALIGNLTGLVMGFVLSAVSVNAKNLHRGYNLYNNGLAMGLIAVATNGILNLFGLNVVSENIILHGVNPKLVIVMCGSFLALMFGRIFISKTSYEDYFDLLMEIGISPAEFSYKYDNWTVLFNMGMCGFLGIAYTILVGGNLNGATLGGIMLVVAFAAFGVTPKNAIPIMLGVFIASFTGIYEVTADGIVIAALFGTCLAPVAGDYGLIAGVITGFMHLALVTKTGVLHSGLFLYNNGFTAGIITAIVVPFFESIRLALTKR